MDSLITIPVLNNVNIPVNIRATLGNLVRQHDEDDGKKMDSNLVVQALRQHGTPLLRWLEAEQREHLPQSVIDRAYRNEFVSCRGSELGDATFNVRLNQFIARKGDLLFKRQAQTQHEVQPVPSDDTYAIMPPLESFMGIPAHHSRHHFFKSVEKGDVLVGVVTSVMDSGLVIQILCMDNEKVRDLDSLKIMAFCPANEITQLHKHFSPTENFQIQDLVRGVVILVAADSEKVVLSLHNSRMAGLADISLGLITEEQFPVHYRRRLAVKGLTFEELMQSILGFKNSGSHKYLTEFHRLQDRESYMRSLNSLQIPEQEYAENVRKLQSARKAHQSVLQGVTLFKQGNYLEAMQHLNRALQIDEKNVEGLVARGALYANKESYSRAIEDFEEALKEDPHHVNAYTYLVETLLAQAKQHEEKKEWTDAEAVYYRVLSVYPDHPEATADLKIVQQKKYQPSSGHFEKFDAIADSFMDLIKERKPGEKVNRRSWSSSSDERSPGRRRSSHNRKGSRSPDSKYRHRRSRDRSRSTDKSRSRRSRSIDSSRKDRRKDSKRRKSKSPNSKRGESKSPESTRDRRKSKSSPGKSSEKSKKNKKEKENKKDENRSEEKSKKKRNKSKSRSPSPNSQTVEKPSLILKPESDLEIPKKKPKVVSPDKGHESSSPEWGEKPSTLHITRARTNSFDEDEYLYGDSAIGYEKETFKTFPGFQEDFSAKTQNEEVLFEDRKIPERTSSPRKQSRDRRKEREVLKLKSFDEDSRSPGDKRYKSKSPDQAHARDKRDSDKNRPSDGKERSHKKRERSKDSSDSDRSRDRSMKDEKHREKPKKNLDKYKSPERSRKDKLSKDLRKSDKKHSKRRDSESPNDRRSQSRSSSDESPNRSKRRSSSHDRYTSKKRRSPSVEHPTRSKRRSPSVEHPTRSKRRSPSVEHPTRSKRRSPSVEHPTRSKRRSPSVEHPTRSKRRSPSVEHTTRSKRRSPSVDHTTRSKRRSISGERPSRNRRRSSSNEKERKPEVSKKKRGDRRISYSPDKATSKKSGQRSGSTDEVKVTGKEQSGGVSKRKSRWDKSPVSKSQFPDKEPALNEKNELENKGGWREVEVKKGSSILYPNPPTESDMFSGSITRTVYRSSKVAEVKPTQVVEPLKSKPSFFVPRQIVISKKPDGKSSNSEQLSTRSDSREDRSQSRSRSRSADRPGRKRSRESQSRRSPDRSRDHHKERSASKESHTSHKTDKSSKKSKDHPSGKNKNRSISRDRSRHSDNSRSRSRERHPKSLPSSRDRTNSGSKRRSSDSVNFIDRSLGPRRNIGLKTHSSEKTERRQSGHRGRSESEDERDDRGRKSNKSTNRSKSRSRSRERSRRSPSPDRRQKQHGKDSSKKRDTQRSDSDESPRQKLRDDRGSRSSRKNRDSYSDQKKDLSKESRSPDGRKSRRSTFGRDDSSSPEIPQKKDQRQDRNFRNRKKSQSPVGNQNEKRKKRRSNSISDNDDRNIRKRFDDAPASSKPKPAKRQFTDSNAKLKTPTKCPVGKKARKFTEEESESLPQERGRERSSSASRSRSPSPNRLGTSFTKNASPPPSIKSKWDSSPKASRWDPPAQSQAKAKQFTFRPVGNPTAKNTLTQLETFLLELKQKKKQGDEDIPKKQDNN